MAERSFKSEVEKLRKGEGERFHGEGILAVTKALLQSGVAYVGGYQGSPISHLMDVFADAGAGPEGRTVIDDDPHAAEPITTRPYPCWSMGWKDILARNGVEGDNHE